MNFLIGYVSNQSPQMEAPSPFCVYDQASFEIAKAYALHFRDDEEQGLGYDDYIATPYQFEAETTGEFDEDKKIWVYKPYKYYCPNYEERSCSTCGESPSELYLRTSTTTVKVRERIYAEVCELVCHSHIHSRSRHPSQSACSYDKEVEIYGRPVEKEAVTHSSWMSGVEWSPDTHKFFHWEDKETVETVLLVANRAKWPIPREIVWMILSYVFVLPTGFRALFNHLHYWYGDVESYQEFNLKKYRSCLGIHRLIQPT